MSLYPVVPGAGDGFAGDGLMVAVRLEDVASPLRDGRPLAPGSASALVVGGTERIRSGEVTVLQGRGGRAGGCPPRRQGPGGRQPGRSRERSARWRSGWRPRRGRG